MYRWHTKPASIFTKRGRRCIKKSFLWRPRMWPGQILTDHVGVQREMRTNRPKSDADLFRFTVCWLKSMKIHWNPLKSIKFHWNPLKSIKIHQNPLKSIEIHILVATGVVFKTLLMPWTSGWLSIRGCGCAGSGTRIASAPRPRQKGVASAWNYRQSQWGDHGDILDIYIYIYICIWYIIYVSMCIYIYKKYTRNGWGSDENIVETCTRMCQWQYLVDGPNHGLRLFVATLQWHRAAPFLLARTEALKDSTRHGFLVRNDILVGHVAWKITIFNR